jgi:hypothetical protein
MNKKCLALVGMIGGAAYRESDTHAYGLMRRVIALHT